MATPTLVLQTTYAELLERCATAAFGASFAANGAFTHKTINGRRYWRNVMLAQRRRTS
jgi:hypothetical protein